MGTRGLWGYIEHDEPKLTYNHFDSYPSGLGSAVLNHLRGCDLDQLKERVNALRIVTEDGDKPTAEDVKRLAEFAEDGYGWGTPEQGGTWEWYTLLRHTQGDPEATLKAGVMIDGEEFAEDSLFCEWAYVVDLDAGTFEIYRGFQREPHNEGRFITDETIPSEGYWPVRLIASYPLTDLPETLDENALSGDDD